MVRKIEETQATLGVKLRALRRDRGITIERLAELTHLHPQVLRNLEQDDFTKLPEPIYAKNFLRTYVKALRGDEHYFLQCFEEARGSCDLVDPLLLPRQKVRALKFLVTPRIFRLAGLGCVALVVLGYLGFEVRRIVIPPTIEIMYPIDGQSTDAAMLSVRGQVFEQVEVSINGEKILLNQDGTFDVPVDLDRGLNLITIEAKKRYSGRSTIYRRVMLNGGTGNVSLDKKPIF